MSLEIDHLLFAGDDLAELESELSASSGVRATRGGRHVGQGTHNALVGLGPGRYLELMARDPRGDEGGNGAYRRSIAYLRGPALHTWCVRVDDMAGLVDRVRALGLGSERMESGRLTPDGVQLKWTVLAVTGHAYGGLVPFFIDWQGSPHPSRSLGRELGLTGLTVAHPDGEGLRALLDALGGPVPDVTVASAPHPRIQADLSGPTGAFTLAGEGGQMRFA
ncbi:MAG: VOC family protein [Trueperaceae bacterium]|nr:VOC family protein [Trueperaceae bacterium]MCC6311862.1 VOC family protein [Trueperaceae bacterium]MCO5174436.1 VOC family protein [Trueperaceae bacterium]MCW5819926.1 VOC family protein [Trueperaceae bacterium]